jgi:2'-5' RNA ligase
VSGPRPNWFIAFPVDEAVGARWLAALTLPPDGARAFHAADLHVTLAFLGPCGAEAAQVAWAQAARIRWDAGPFTPGPLAPFGPRSHPSTWAVEPRGGAPWLRDLLAAHAGPLARAAGARPGHHGPRPHVSLARTRRGTSGDALAAWARHQQLPELPATLDRLALWTWSEDRRSRLFRIVAEVPARLP